MYAELEGVDIGNTKSCPFCQGPAVFSEDRRELFEQYVCRRCGKFRLGGMANWWLHNLNPSNRSRLYKVSFALRTAAERRLAAQDSSNYPTHSGEDLSKMLDSVEPTVQQKSGLLLRHFARITKYPGEAVEFDVENDYTIIAARNAPEARFYMTNLSQRKLLYLEPSYTGSTKPRGTVSGDGWNELDVTDRAGEQSADAFIAMAFHPDRDPYERAISKAIKAAGYRPVRIDQVEHVNKIDDEIIARIRSAKFLVADFTLQRNGVYFEAGFMLGLGRTVIWLCEKSELERVHFDTRQYNTIDYVDAEDLTKRLQIRIEALLGKGLC